MRALHLDLILTPEIRPTIGGDGSATSPRKTLVNIHGWKAMARAGLHVHPRSQCGGNQGELGRTSCQRAAQGLAAIATWRGRPPAGGRRNAGQYARRKRQSHVNLNDVVRKNGHHTENGTTLTIKTTMANGRALKKGAAEFKSL